MLVFARKFHNLQHLGFSHFIGIDTAFADPVLVHTHHYSLRGGAVLVEEPLQYVHDKLHRSVVIVHEQHTVEAGTPGPRLALGNDRRPRGRSSVPPSPKCGSGSLGRRLTLDWISIHAATACFARTCRAWLVPQPLLGFDLRQG
jgi:hypothetical protein